MTEARITHGLRGAARPSLEQARAWIGDRVTDSLGVGVGRLLDVWVDAETGEPAWLLIREGRFGGDHKLVPFAGATEGGGRIWLPYERDLIRSAPAVGAGDVLTAELGGRLREHFGVAPRQRPAPQRTRPRYDI